jgi:diaminopimelate decarboxylase
MKAGFPMDRVSFHGNNKSRAELAMAVDQGVGVIILDNFHEIDLLLSQILEGEDASGPRSCSE